MIGVCVDDLLIMGKSQKDINLLKKTLTTRFKMTDRGPVIHYLGLRITGDLASGTMFLNQKTYVQKILERFGMQNAKGVDTLMAKKNILVHTDLSYQEYPLIIT